MDHPWTHTHIYGSGVTWGNDMGGKPKLRVT